eukprot:TRINITY_DN1154_c0_g1_i1.p2 TRINITY_DN1154_c0_g1~~TRINITY_DN1154_c0_g1_i1.p2  ORF type:complete len:174 (+),score=58.06 TRINITY_DN1154_c0_g1_i1:1133-1654(+)
MHLVQERRHLTHPQGQPQPQPQPRQRHRTHHKMLSLLVVAALVPSLQRPCTEDKHCEAGWTCRSLLKTAAVFPERGECFGFKVCTKKSQEGEKCGGLVEECETNVCADGLDCTFNGHQPGTCHCADPCKALPVCPPGFQETDPSVCNSLMWDAGICKTATRCCHTITCRTWVL